MECSSANLDHLADISCNSGPIDLDPAQRLRTKCPPATFSRSSPVSSFGANSDHVPTINFVHGGRIDQDSVQRVRLRTALDDRTLVEIASNASHGDSDLAGRQELKRERGKRFAGSTFRAPSNPECSEAMASVFQSSQKQAEEEEETQSHLDSVSSSRPRQRRLLNDKGPGHAPCNMPFAASSRVSFEEVLAKVAAFPPLRDMLGTTGTVTIERAIASHPAREAKQPEKQCELDPYCTNAPPSRATTDEFALLQDIQPLLSYPSLRDLLQTSANETGVRRKGPSVTGKKTRQQTENRD